MLTLFLRTQLLSARGSKKLREVSEDTGISVSYLSDIERGRTLPSLKTLITLCDYYGIVIGDLFEVSPHKRRRDEQL